jgi:DNA helicase-2/ATP-dependent DNA helicase PcrA
LKQEEGTDGPDPDSDHITHVQQLINIAKDFSTVGAFLDYVSKMEKLLKESRHKKKVDAVVLSSIHRFKGIERDYVFCPGWSEGILPHAKNPDPDEELRIAYVAITRAAKRFTASWTQVGITQSGMNTLEPSRFIAKSKMPVRRLKTIKEKQNIDVLKFLEAHPEFIEKENE